MFQDTRGGTDKIETDLKHSNFVMIFGTTPSNQVLLETKMVENLLDHLILKQHPKLKIVEFPSVLEQIRTDDAKFELAVSNTIKKLTLYHRSSVYKRKYENVVSKSIGLVFVNTGTIKKPYNAANIVER